MDTAVVVALIAAVATVLAPLLPLLIRLNREMKPNGGKSFRDEVQHIRRAVEDERARNRVFRHEVRNDLMVAKMKADTAFDLIREHERQPH